LCSGSECLTLEWGDSVLDILNFLKKGGTLFSLSYELNMHRSKKIKIN
jgi:hypothetical protein